MMEKIKSDTKTKLLTILTVSIPVVILWIDFYKATNKSLAIMLAFVFLSVGITNRLSFKSKTWRVKVISSFIFLAFFFFCYVLFLKEFLYKR